ncbi:hypothetical protein ScPMuIL_018901 [Solemya velum]
MGKLNIFEITLNDALGVFYAGQILQGHVTVELNEGMKMREIRLKFEGKAYVHWTEQHHTGSGKNRRTRTVHYSANEYYFNTTVPLYGKGLGQGDTSVLPAGRHTYPFQFQLPPGLPSSFEGSDGHVRYSIKGTIDKPWKFDHTTKRAFTVICLLDLNREPTALTPAQGENNKMVCCLCCASGPISSILRLDRRGYVPGEAIMINAEINNLSSRRMVSSSVKLKMCTTFHATTKSRSTSKDIVKVTRGEIAAGGSDYWTGERLVIPPLPPSYLAGCQIIDIQYILELTVDPAGPALDLHVPLELILGTIPLQSVVQQYSRQQQLPITAEPLPTKYGIEPAPLAMPYAPPTMPSAPPTMPSAPAAGFRELPPPSYSECVFGKVNIKDENDSDHTRGDLNYAPVYTYYNWNEFNK